MISFSISVLKVYKSLAVHHWLNKLHTNRKIYPFVVRKSVVSHLCVCKVSSKMASKMAGWHSSHTSTHSICGGGRCLCLNCSLVLLICYGLWHAAVIAFHQIKLSQLGLDFTAYICCILLHCKRMLNWCTFPTAMPPYCLTMPPDTSQPGRATSTTQMEGLLCQFTFKLTTLLSPHTSVQWRTPGLRQVVAYQAITNY